MERLAAALTFLLVVSVNFLAASTELIGGVLTQEISEKYPTLITPRGYVFSIWLLIYLFLGLFVISVLRGGEVSSRVLRFFILSNLLNVAWIFLWHYEQLLLSTLVNAALMIAVTLVYLEQDRRLPALNLKGWVVNVFPFSLYLSWLMVAVVANVAVFLKSIGWDGFGISEEAWAALVLLVVTAISATAGLRQRDFTFPAVLAWAVWGIKYERELALFALSLTTSRIISLVVLLVAVLLFLMRLAKR
ncbi:MAG: hypothetical protein NZ902_01175 [Acidilobaceae archaeon]|nr:hypothetical protein [Acidilobaceae archaeon]MCX8165438.1 hypothetical protein [Acidilobaceae archaeon]MDW7973865.1 hypothetical protein [Sulfolobales archaeon]